MKMVAQLWTRMGLVLIAASVVFAKTPTIDQAIAEAANDVRDSDMLADDGSVLVELDMRFPYDEWALIQAERARSTKSRQKRKALRRVNRLWHNGVLPYSFLPGFSARAKTIIRSAMKSWADMTCLNFREAEEEEPSITFVPSGGCSSYVGKTGRPGQPVTLGPNCLYKGVIMHELGHAFGFIHEHSRPDRDQFITIEYQNVKMGMESQFQKFPARLINLHSIPYDYRSIMHYGQYYFSKNQLATIKTKSASAARIIGNRYFPSFNDIRLANVMYSCTDMCRERKACPDGFQGKDCRCWCKGRTFNSPLVYCDTKKPVGSESPPGGAPTTPSAASTAAPVPTTPAPKPTAGPVDPNGNKPGDRLSRCGYWARRGECDISPRFMQYYCNASCAGMIDRCEDTNPYQCRAYARLCGIWTVLQRYCRKTCGVCTVSQRFNSCQDTSVRSCRLLTIMGMCRHKVPSVRRNVERACPKSCGKCEVSLDGGPCRDRTPRACKLIKAQGRCNTTNQAEVNTLKTICAKTCDLCPKTRVGRVTQSFCLDRMDRSDCQKMAQERKCRRSIYRASMMLVCRRTCGFCNS